MATKIFKPQTRKHLPMSELIKRTRDWREHHRLGAALRDETYRMKEATIGRMGIKKTKAEERFLKEYSMERQDWSRMRSEMGILMAKLGKVHPKIEQEIMGIHQFTLFRQYVNAEMSLKTTHIYFANVASFMVAVNMHPQYSYGKIYGDKCEVEFYNSEGRTVDFDGAAMRKLRKELLKAIKKMRLKKKKTFGEVMGNAGKAREAIFDDDAMHGMGGEAVSFADCEGEVEDTMTTLNEMAKKMSDLELPKPPAVATTQEPPETPPEYLVRPVFHTFIEPFLHNMLSPDFYALLPPSPYWTYRKEYLHGEDSQKLFVTSKEQLAINRSPYPLPPPSLSQTHEHYGNASIVNDHTQASGWSVDRASYKKEWKEDWSKGWTPKGFLTKGGDDDEVVM